uniref:Uncharacterized protein n=1 Tax=Meloidogyne enterolobii TaxID=390850 RepID=A0A6V7WVR3_MELEN|nr:unnamed protein product [Meloidogyne enterolobii]
MRQGDIRFGTGDALLRPVQLRPRHLWLNHLRLAPILTLAVPPLAAMKFSAILENPNLHYFSYIVSIIQ